MPELMSDLRGRTRVPRAKSLAAIALLLGALVAFGVGVAGAEPLGQITEFSSGFNPGAIAGSLTPGADGNLWFTDRGTGSMGRITPEGAISEYPLGLPAGSVPGSGSGGGLSYGPDGNLWFTDSGRKAIGVFNPFTHDAVSEFSAGLNPGSVPNSLVAGGDGNVWFTDQGATKAIGVINPTTHAISEFSSGLNAGSLPGIPTFGPDGNIWFADGGTTKAIGRIDVSTHAIAEFSSGISSTGVSRPIAGPDGNLWFGDKSRTAPAVGRITPNGVITEFPVTLLPGQFLNAANFGPDGGLWIGSQTPGGISRFDLTTHAYTTFSNSLSGNVGVIVAGPDLNVWISDSGAAPAFARVGTGVCPGSSQGCNLSGLNVPNIVLVGAQLQGDNLAGADLENARLIGASLQGDNLNNVNLTGAQLQLANLSGANLQGVSLAGANLTGASLQGSNLQGANLTSANLTGANLQGDNLQGGNLTGANLTGASLTGANLQGAILTNANLTGDDLRGANLQGANLTGATLTNTDFSGANLGGQRFLRRIGVVTLPAPFAVPASFDIGFVDPTTQGYYLADHTNAGVDAIDGSSDSFGSVIGAGLFSLGGNTETAAQIAACGRGGGPTGVLSLSVGGVNQLWAADAVSAANPVSNVKVFTLSTPTSGTLAATIATAVAANGTNGTCRADEVAHDPRDQLVVVANDRAPDRYVSLISVNANPAADAVVAQIKFPEAVNGIEQPVWDPETGEFYINIPGVEVAVIDPVTLSLKTTYPTPGCSASGLALDELTQQLLLSCSLNPNGVAFMDARTGAITAHFPQVSGADEVWFDPGTRNFYLAASSMTSTGQAGGTPTPVLGVISAGQAASGSQAQWLVNVPTGAGAHSVAADAVNGQVFVPIAGLGGIAVYAWTSP